MKHEQTYGLYAVYLGYTPIFSHDHPFDAGRLRVNCGVTFHLGHVEVWETERGWRVGEKGIDGVFKPHAHTDFFRRLPDALLEGSRRYRQQQDEIARQSGPVVKSKGHIVGTRATLTLGKR